MELVLDIVSWFCILTGAFFSLTGAIGLFRFPDFFSRVHAVSMDDSLGVMLILLGLLLQNGLNLNAAKLLFIFFFFLFTNSASTHALTKAARQDGVDPLPGNKSNK